MVLAAATVTDQARHHDLMHGVDHAGGGAGAPQRIADFDNIRDRYIFAAEFSRRIDAHQALFFGGGDGGLRKAAGAGDNGRILRGDGGHALRALLHIVCRCVLATRHCRWGRAVEGADLAWATMRFSKCHVAFSCWIGPAKARRPGLRQHDEHLQNSEGFKFDSWLNGYRLRLVIADVQWRHVERRLPIHRESRRGMVSKLPNVSDSEAPR